MTDEKNTQQDILETLQFLKENMASKTDLVDFATKDDLKSFATKDDLKSFATKDDLKSFATKDDLRNLEVRVTSDLYEVKDHIMNHMDGFIALHQKLDIELKALRAKYDRLEGYIQQLAKHAQIDLQ